MSINGLCKSNTLFPSLILCFLTVFFLSACGFSGDRNGTNGRTSSNNNSNGNANEDETGVFEVKEKIGIRVERINGDVNSVGTSQISIVSLNENFIETGADTPDYRVLARDSGGYEIQFSSNYVEKLNQVVKVTFSTRTTPPEFLYAPLYTVNSDTESITVSAKSHYLLKKMFDAVASETQLNNLLPCSSSETECANQPTAKSNFLEQVNIAVTAYNVDIPEDSTVSEALNLLDQRPDLKLHIESAINEITRTTSPFAKGTRRSFNLSTVGLFTPNTYHSLMFGLSFSNVKPDDSFRSVKINSFSSTIIEANTFNDNVKPVYPSFSQTTSMLDLRRDVMSTDIPFKRTSLEIAQNNSFTLIENEELNAFTSNLTDSFLSTEGFLLNERVISQTIPGEDTDIQDVGWEFEPVFSRLYQVNGYEPPVDNTLSAPPEPDYGNAATWLVSSNYSKTASFRLSEETNEPEDRRTEQLEDSHLFSWEVHGLQVDKDDDFSTSEMNGKEYGAISYSLKLNDEDNANVLRVIAETANWEINSGQISMSQPSSFFRTYSLSRADDNDTLGVRIESNLLDTPRSITTVETNDSNGFSQQGLIAFGGQQTGKPQGHASANGSYLAFVFNTLDKADALDRGQGILLATEFSDFNYEFSGERYLLQGNSFEITEEKNTLHQLNGSTLVISDNTLADPVDIACNASLSLQRTSIEHTVGEQDNTLSDPLQSEQTNIASDACSINRNQLQLEFSNVFGQDLILRGFITQKNDPSSNAPGNLINLIWQQDNQLGLIFANKDQALSPTFEE